MAKQSAEKQKTVPAVLNPKRPWLWLILAAVTIAAVAITLCLLLTPPAIEIPDALDDCIVSTLRAVHLSEHTEGKYPAVAYEALGITEAEDTVTVYGVMMYREYTCTTDGVIKLWGAANGPFAVTATQKEDGTYEATECWWPEGGENHASSIRKKFPLYCEADAIDFQSFYTKHDAACQAAVTQNAADERWQYTVLESEADNVWLYYCPNNTGAYVEFDGGIIVDGNYAIEDGVMTYTFGTRKVALKLEGKEYVFSAALSEKLPEIWTTNGDEQDFLIDGVCFMPSAGADAAHVGDSLVIKSHGWMAKEKLEKMFGYLPDNSHVTDSSVGDKPYYLPIKVLKNRAELDWLLASHMEDPEWPDFRQETFTQFDEAFFEKNSLVMVYYNNGTDCADPAVAAYKFTEEGTCLSARLAVPNPAEGDTVLTQWLLFSGIHKSDMEEIKVLEAYVDRTIAESSVVESTLSFTGKVKQVEGHAVLMGCDSVPQFSSGVWVELGDAELVPMVGEEYVVTYEDIVMPSLPPRITAVTITPKS